jgi:hypothetical protein
MADVLYLLTVVVSFAAFVGLVRLCDRIVEIPTADEAPLEVDR